MKFIYKTVINQIIDENVKAALAGREILKVQLTRAEYFKLHKECPVLRCEASIIDVRPGLKGKVDGIDVEVV